MPTDSNLLNWLDAQVLLKQYGIALGGETVERRDLAAKAAACGYPVVLKGYTAAQTHKKEHGLVKIGLANEQALTNAFAELQTVMASLPGANVVALQPMVLAGLELVVGGRRDATFGPVVMFGLGGTLVEALNDVVFAMAPLDHQRALDLISRWPRVKLLDGYRGMAIVNREELATIVVGLGQLLSEHPDIQEVDLNPLMAGSQGLIPVDARITCKEGEL